MCKILCLASMDMRTENSNDIAIFFNLFNEVLSKVKGQKNYKFNLRAFVCDEGGANYKAIRMVYGNDFCKNRVFGCQFHFLNDMHKRKHEVKENMREKLYNYVRNCAMKLQLLANTMFTNQDWMRLGNCIQLLASSSIGGMTEEVTYFLLSVGGITRCESL